MTKNISELKCAIWSEWQDNGGFGTTRLCFCSWGTEYENLMWPIYEMSGHLDFLDDREDLDDLIAIRKPTEDYIKKFYFDSGGFGCHCSLLVEGEEIVPKILNLYSEEIQEWLGESYGCWVDEDWVEDEEEEKENEEYAYKGEQKLTDGRELLKAIILAKDHPDDFDAVADLLDILDQSLEFYNDSQY